MLVIQMAQEARRTARELPLVLIVGVIAMVVAGVLDVVVHLSSSDHAAHAGAAHAGAVPAHLAHLVRIAGMVLVLAGVVTHGLRRQLRQRAARNGGFDHDAHR